MRSRELLSYEEEDTCMSYEAACGSFSSDIQPKMVAILRMYGCVCVCVWLCVWGGEVGVWGALLVLDAKSQCRLLRVRLE